MAYYTAGIIGSYFRNLPGTIDMSGGNITIAGTLNAASASIATVTPSNLVVSGYIRNALTPSEFDISGGNISNSGTTLSGTFTTLNALTSNVIGGVILENSNISNSGTTLSTRFTTISANSSNDIGGVLLSNSNVSTTNALLSGYLRNALTPTTLDISGGIISNSVRILTGAGTVAAPSYSFGGDGALGLYDPASNVLGFVTSGSERMRIDPSGNVGIGATTLSNYRLSLRSGGGSNAGIVFHRSTNDIPYVGMVYDETADGLVFRTNVGTTDLNCNAMTIKRASPNAGAVGIGTTVPAHRLDVSGGSIQTNQFLYFNTADADKIYLTNFSNTGSKIAHSTGWSVDIAAGPTTSAFGIVRILRGSASGHIESARFDSNGRLGINCNAPGYMLDICGTATFDGMRITSSTGSTVNLYVRGSEAVANTMQLFANSNSGGLHQFDSTRTMNFITNSTTRMAIGTNGRVAIGTNFSNPAYMLDVSSSAANTASINMTTWPRTTMSTSYFGVYSTGDTNAIRWTQSNAIDTNLMIVGSNAGNGTYFVVKRSGIWSVQAVFSGVVGGVPASTFDVSTNIAHNGLNSIANPQLAFVSGDTGYGQFSVGYTGFLPSNDSNYYKIKLTNITPAAGYNGGKLFISFMSESPIVTGVPY